MTQHRGRAGRKRSLWWGLLPLVLVGVGAWFFSRPALEADLQRQAEAALKAAGQGWARVRVEGRDAALEGKAPSRVALEAAKKAVLKVYGIRRVVLDKVKLTPLTAPVVNKVVAAKAPVVITGAWKQTPDATLVVEVDGKRYVLGEAKELESKDGTWRLTLSTLPREGAHDVVVIVTEGGREKRDTTRDELVVDTTPPKAATFTDLVSNDPRAVISGTWPSDDAKALEVELDGKVHRLGESPNLKVQGDRWVLTTDAPLPPGSHTLKMRVADAAGNLRESSAVFDVAAPDTTPPNAPVIDALLANNPRAVISGTWPAEDAKLLEVELDGRKFVMGQTDALKVKDKIWRLYPPDPLAEGKHKVLARAIDAAGNKAEATREIIIDTTAPEVPEVAAMTVKSGERPELSGPLPADVASMKITIGKDTWVLDAEGSPLKRTVGGWRLQLPKALPEGKHDVVVAVIDEAGNVARKKFAGVIVVQPKDVPPETTEQPAPQPVADADKCQQDISTFLKENTIRFRSDSDLLTDEGIVVVAKLANLIRKCPGLRFHIVGHTDSRGDFQHNRELSARRAETVKNALVGAGIAADRLTTEGAGESFPIASNDTEEGRALNRRIEIKVLKPE